MKFFLKQEELLILDSLNKITNISAQTIDICSRYWSRLSIYCMCMSLVLTSQSCPWSELNFGIYNINPGNSSKINFYLLFSLVDVCDGVTRLTIHCLSNKVTGGTHKSTYGINVYLSWMREAMASGYHSGWDIFTEHNSY